MHAWLDPLTIRNLKHEGAQYEEEDDSAAYPGSDNAPGQPAELAPGDGFDPSRPLLRLDRPRAAHRLAPAPALEACSQRIKSGWGHIRANHIFSLPHPHADTRLPGQRLLGCRLDGRDDP